jgi:uncharacterized membrane protein
VWGFWWSSAADVVLLVGSQLQMWVFWLSDVVVLVVGVCVLVVADVGAASRSAAGRSAAADVGNFVVGET